MGFSGECLFLNSFFFHYFPLSIPMPTTPPFIPYFVLKDFQSISKWLTLGDRLWSNYPQTYIEFLIMALRTRSSSLLQKINSFILQFYIVFHATKTFSLKIKSSPKTLVFFGTLIGKIKSFIFLSKLLRDWVFFTSPQWPAFYRGVVCSGMEYASHTWDCSTHANKMEVWTFFSYQISCSL